MRAEPGVNIEYFSDEGHGGFKRIAFHSPGLKEKPTESHAVKEDLISDAASLSFGEMVTN